MVINLNDAVAFTPTTEGLSVLRSHYRGLRLDPAAYVPPDGPIELGLWEFAHIFGTHLVNGGPQLIEGNILLIRRRQ